MSLLSSGKYIYIGLAQIVYRISVYRKDPGSIASNLENIANKILMIWVLRKVQYAKKLKMKTLILNSLFLAAVCRSWV